MAHFFPQHTGSFKLEEPPAFQRFSRQLLPMAIVTGVVIRLLRAYALTRGPSESFLYMSGLLALGIVILCGMATLHLGNYTLRHWTWRAPAFALLEAATESLVALALIALGVEPMGSSRAAFADWPELAVWTFFLRLTTVISFALALSGVVQLVRYQLVKRDARGHTLDAVHHEVQAAEREKARRADQQ